MGSTQQPFSEAENNWDLERLYADLADAKREYDPKARPGLTETEKTHLRGLLCEYGPAQIAYILNIAPRGLQVTLSNGLYRYVEILTNREEKTLQSWRDIVNWLSAAGYRTTQPQQTKDWGEAPEVSVFYGRDTEQKTLKQWIVQDRCRVVTLLGMQGIGKTALAVRLAEQVQDEFEYVVWRSLPNKPLPLAEILIDIINFLSGKTNTDLPNNVDTLISKLRDFLNQHRVLLIFDVWENVLSRDCAGSCKVGYEDYGNLLRRIAHERHQSCLVITTSERPEQLTECEGNNRPVRSWKLEGLDDAAAIEIFTADELQFAAVEAKRLNHMYRGNVLALIHISKMIQELFNHSVTEFLILGTIPVPSPIEMPINERLESLPELEREILRCLASSATPLDCDTLRSQISTQEDKSEFVKKLYDLCGRSLIEKCYQDAKVLYTLQPVVSKCVNRFFRS